jgi:hypothetical protein
MDEDAAAVQAFSQRAANQHVRVDTIECRPSSSGSITWLARFLIGVHRAMSGRQ